VDRSGAHDADVLLTSCGPTPMRRKTQGHQRAGDPPTPKVFVAPTVSSILLHRRPGISTKYVLYRTCGVPAENLVGELNQGWRVPTAALGHERTMMWLGFADCANGKT